MKQPRPQSPCKRFKGKKLGKHEYWSPNLVNKIQKEKRENMVMTTSNIIRERTPDPTKVTLPRIFEAYDLQGWKLIYLVLYKTIADNPDLMDVDFFNDLQTYLQRNAENNNVNPLDHEEWIKWLNV